MITRIWNKLFLSPYFFTIALRRKSTALDLENPSFSADFVIPATKNRWVADPIFAEHLDHTYLFYEAVVEDKGRIEVCEVHHDGSLSSPEVILEDECHYSYPYVFQYNDQWYMIPESSSREEIRLYKATNFPYQWEPDQILLHKKCVDTTVFEADGQWFLLSFQLHTGSERVTPLAYTITFQDDHMELSPVDWDEYSELTCRGAGPVIARSGRLYRPSQINQEFMYGNCIQFNQIISRNPYSEQLVSHLSPASIRVNGIWFDGAHTYTESSCFEAIDIRCREFDFWKIPRTLFRKAMHTTRKSSL